ncbi:MAG: hypothetical protein F4Y14_05835 [Acidobacteria bacterium]|nr:hypothetical protein [Acidobacteriota bacterium]MYH72823.1 hypothetical protein [Acidimicrobiia bacterium]
MNGQSLSETRAVAPGRPSAVLMGAVALLMVVGHTGRLEAQGPWVPYEETDPFTDVERIGVKLGDISIWCAKESRLAKKLLHGIILTEEPPEEKWVDNSVVGGWNEVRVEYRFDNARRQVAGFDRTEDGEGVRLDYALKHSAKVWAQKLYQASKLVYRVDTHSGEQVVTYDLTQGREHLKSVMDACNVKPKTFKDLGGR